MLALAFVFVFLFVFVLAGELKQRELSWCGGEIERGSLIPTEHGHRFTIMRGWGCKMPRFDVVHEGALPDTVCDGSEVGLEGWMAGGVFHATRVYGGSASKYDACRAWRCRPDHERPRECRTKFE